MYIYHSHQNFIPPLKHISFQKPPTSSPTSHPTIDVNECSDNTHSCDANAECTNTQGSYTCECNHGYTGDGFECTNINECATDTANDCDERAQCTDTEGGYTCDCPDGWIGDGKVCETASPTASPSVAPSRGPSQGPTSSPVSSISQMCNEMSSYFFGPKIDMHIHTNSQYIHVS